MDDRVNAISRHPAHQQLSETIELPEQDPTTIVEVDALLSYLYWKSTDTRPGLVPVFATLIDRYLDLRNELDV